MSTSLIALLLVLLQSYHTTAAITCDQELVMKRPISCRRSLPCNYMLPVIPEDFPKEWSLEEQGETETVDLKCKFTKNCKQAGGRLNGDFSVKIKSVKKFSINR